MTWIKYQQKCLICKGEPPHAIKVSSTFNYCPGPCYGCGGKGYIEIELRKVDDDRDT